MKVFYPEFSLFSELEINQLSGQLEKEKNNVDEVIFFFISNVAQYFEKINILSVTIKCYLYIVNVNYIHIC